MNNFPANDDPFYLTRMFELYQGLLKKWNSDKVPMPSFEQWHYAMNLVHPGQRALHAGLDDREIFSILETFVVHLGQAQLSLNRVPGLKQTLGANQEARFFVERFGLDQRFENRLCELFSNYVEDGVNLFGKSPGGAIPEAQAILQDNVRQLIKMTEHHLDVGKVTFDRASGIVEGALALMTQSGAMQKDIAEVYLRDFKRRFSVQVDQRKQKFSFFARSS